MDWNEAGMLAAGLVTVALLGAWHLGGLLLLKRLKPSADSHSYLAVLTTFWGLLILHFSEIVACALILELALTFPGAGAIGGGYGDSLGGTMYLAGVSFTSLGYTAQTVTGPLRLLIMAMALGGFMLITWSATFVYSLWADRFR